MGYAGNYEVQGVLGTSRKLNLQERSNTGARTYKETDGHERRGPVYTIVYQPGAAAC